MGTYTSRAATSYMCAGRHAAVSALQVKPSGRATHADDRADVAQPVATSGDARARGTPASQRPTHRESLRSDARSAPCFETRRAAPDMQHSGRTVYCREPE